MSDFEFGVLGSAVIWFIAFFMLLIIGSRMPKDLE